MVHFISLESLRKVSRLPIDAVSHLTVLHAEWYTGGMIVVARKAKLARRLRELQSA